MIIFGDLQSGVLQFYDLISTGNGSSNASVTGRCRECGKTIKGFRNITSNFVTHLRNVHKQVYEAYDLTRPHKGSRKRSRSNVCDPDASGNNVDDSMIQNREVDRHASLRNDDDSAIEKRLRGEVEVERRGRKPGVKREVSQQETASNCSSVRCLLADCVTPRCDALHAAILRLAVSSADPSCNKVSLRSLLHSSIAMANGIPSVVTNCPTCSTFDDLLVATYLRTRAKVRELIAENDAQVNMTFDLLRLARRHERDTDLLIGATLNFVPNGTASETFLYTTTVALARVACTADAVDAFAHSVRDRVTRLTDGAQKVKFGQIRIASVSCELDSLETLCSHNVSLLQTHDEVASQGANLDALRSRLVRSMCADDNSCADLTPLRCFQKRVERALNNAIRVATRNSEPFRELRRSVTALRGTLERAHHAAVALLHTSIGSDMRNCVSNAALHSNGTFLESNGRQDVKLGLASVSSASASTSSQFAEAELRAFVGWLKTVQMLDAASVSTGRWNVEMKTLRRLLDVDAAKAALLRHVGDVDLEWLVEPKRPEADWLSTLREFVAVVQPFEEVLDVFDASSQISVSLAVPCLFGFDSHLNECATNVQAEPNRTLVHEIRANLHSEFAFVFSALEGDYSRLEASERRVVETLLCGTLLDPRFKITCFEEAPPHKAVAMHALRHMLGERVRTDGNTQVEREIDEYFDEDIIAQVNDPLRVLEFWRSNAHRWPSLHRLANEILAVPATRSPFQRAIADLLASVDASHGVTPKSETVPNGDGDLCENVLATLDRLGNLNLNWLDSANDDYDSDLLFNEAKRFALKCNLDLLDHAKFFSV